MESQSEASMKANKANKGRQTSLLHTGKTTTLLDSPRQTMSRRAAWPIFLAFLAGIVVTLLVLFLFFLFFLADRPGSSVSQLPVSRAITVQVGRDYLTQVVQKELRASGLPGTISNVQIVLEQNNLMMVSGDDQLNVLGFTVTKHFTLLMQLSVSSCQLHTHVVHADLEGIPVTGFVATFENQINQQLRMQQTGLPSGFIYCVSGVQTQTNDIEIVDSAMPTK